MDPATLVKLWLAIRPIHRLREHRKAKRAARRREAEGAATEGIQFEEEDSGMNADQIDSIGRTVAKWLGGAVSAAAVTHGYIDAAQADTLTTALVAIAGGLVTLYGVWRSHKKHA